MKWQTLKLAVKGHLATIMLNRPDVSNAFNETLVKELESSFRELTDSREIRVIVLAGIGKCFSAGADLRWMKTTADLSEEENLADA